MSARAARASVARETLAILERGDYVNSRGDVISIRDALGAARLGTVLYAPADFGTVLSRRVRLLAEQGESPSVQFEVENETTLSAARRLVSHGERPLALNFASARNPGGGFLKGSQAQEESLARASGLYACVNPQQRMYQANREYSSSLYTDHMIYSPDVPVFRDDDDVLLERPYSVSFLTAPAVNAGAVRTNEPRNVSRIGPTMRTRIETVLSVAVCQGHGTLVLGAWGCGVFRNDPQAVADWFAEVLMGDGVFRTAFRTVVFAVLDGTPEHSFVGPFERRFTTPR